METETITRRRLYEDVKARLEDDILQGRIAPGDQFPSERDLMKRFGVGRPAVRDALFALQKMGLAQVGGGVRARVTRPTPAALVNELGGAARLLMSEATGARQFLEARCFFEIALARNAARLATDEDIAKLAAALEVHRRALGNPRALERADVAFHFEIVRITRNPIFTALHNAVVEWLTDHRTQSMRLGAEAEQNGFRGHCAIFEAIRDRDPDRAEASMQSHLAVLLAEFG